MRESHFSFTRGEPCPPPGWSFGVLRRVPGRVLRRGRIIGRLAGRGFGVLGAGEQLVRHHDRVRRVAPIENLREIHRQRKGECLGVGVLFASCWSSQVPCEPASQDPRARIRNAFVVTKRLENRADLDLDPRRLSHRSAWLKGTPLTYGYDTARDGGITVWYQQS